MGIIQKLFLLFASISGAFGVIFGAIGSHWLKDRLNYWDLSSFETGVRYQLYHSLALLAVVVLMERVNSSFLTYSGISFIAGTLLFSGSIYLLSIRSLYDIMGQQFLGPVTPVGGVLLIIGWIFMGLAAIQLLRG
jgi:uncharacterized membrane protein YgdD (TMEM256/DUF423 family)